MGGYSLLYVGLATCPYCQSFSDELWPALKRDYAHDADLDVREWMVANRTDSDWARAKQSFSFKTVPAILLCTTTATSDTYSDADFDNSNNVPVHLAQISLFAGDRSLERIRAWTAASLSPMILDRAWNSTHARWQCVALTSSNADERVSKIVRALCVHFHDTLVCMSRILLSSSPGESTSSERSRHATTLCMWDAALVPAERRRHYFNVDDNFDNCQQWIFETAFRIHADSI